MRALRINELAGPDGLAIEEIDSPSADGMVVIDVKSAGVAFPDLLMSRGEYQVKPEPPFTPGSEGSGVVREAPEGSGFAAGDRVAALSLGMFAETAIAAPQMTFPLPDVLSFDEGAALIINYHTALFALEHRGRLAAGDTVLIHGAAGGVGTASAQIAKAMGARVIGVVSNEDKAAVAREAGADEILFSDDDWRSGVKELTGGAGVDVVLDPVGGDRFTDSLRSLREAGRLLVVGFAEGSIPEVKVNRLLLRNLDVVGVAWGAYVATRPELAREIGDKVNEMARSGAVKPLIGQTFAIDQAADALRCLDERRARGKVVLKISE